MKRASLLLQEFHARLESRPRLSWSPQQVTTLPTLWAPLYEPTAKQAMVRGACWAVRGDADGHLL